MESFLNLPEEKQNAVVNAALMTFGANGYRKTSVSDIASAAGISKSMVFHYFGSKKALYLYLVDHCGHLISDAINEQFDTSVTDFFDIICQSTQIEVGVIKKHPYIFAFVKSAYFEADKQVRAELEELFARGDDTREKIMGNMDVSKFKEGIDSKLVLKMLTWLVEGYIGSLPNHPVMDFDQVFKEFNQCIQILKSGLYKEEEQ